MNKSVSSKTGLFLLELIIAILFFSVSGAICVQLFVQSHITSRNSVELSRAVEWCQNVAEAFYGCDGNVKEMMMLFENSYKDLPASETVPETCDTFYLNFNKDFEPTPTFPERSFFNPYDHAYKVTVTIYHADEFIHCDITADSAYQKEPVYTLALLLPEQKEDAHE